MRNEPWTIGEAWLWANQECMTSGDGAHVYDHSWGTAPRLEETHGRKDCKNKSGPLSKGE